MMSKGRHSFLVELVFEFELFSFVWSSFGSLVVLVNLCESLLLSSVVFWFVDKLSKALMIDGWYWRASMAKVRES